MTSDCSNSIVFKVAKNRYSGDLGIMPLDFDKSSLSFAPKKRKEKEEKEKEKT